jgi:hypothetical protein
MDDLLFRAPKILQLFYKSSCRELAIIAIIAPSDLAVAECRLQSAP